MCPFYPTCSNTGQPHRPWLGDSGPLSLPTVPMHLQLNPVGFPSPAPNLVAANPMVAVAAGNPFLMMQLFGKARQLQNLGFLTAVML
ncbi:hypothetical protein GUJ93_ZPchr0006g45779 [Zizania palustris]|uniref:Uncharacterized protein n=1 Tax=Zizania palustris TaxID=103762 RepID=A0A8J5SDH3_ZIZPA|nr:hypothetical protein GUJ93_ZPchr0006g45779 [Zizania palustris]